MELPHRAQNDGGRRGRAALPGERAHGHRASHVTIILPASPPHIRGVTDLGWTIQGVGSVVVRMVILRTEFRGRRPRRAAFLRDLACEPGDRGLLPPPAGEDHAGPAAIVPALSPPAP